MHFLIDVVDFFASAMVLEPGAPPTALEPEMPDTFFGPSTSSVMSAAATEAIVQGTVFLPSFTDFAEAMFVSNDHFRPLSLEPQRPSQSPPFLMWMSTWGTTSQGLRRPKEGSTTTQPTILKILEDYDVLPMAQKIISVEIYVK
jgi:hypothetical protein